MIHTPSNVNASSTYLLLTFFFFLLYHATQHTADVGLKYLYLCTIHLYVPEIKSWQRINGERVIRAPVSAWQWSTTCWECTRQWWWWWAWWRGRGPAAPATWSSSTKSATSMVYLYNMMHQPSSDSPACLKFEAACLKAFFGQSILLS